MYNFLIEKKIDAILKFINNKKQKFKVIIRKKLNMLMYLLKVGKKLTQLHDRGMNLSTTININFLLVL
jgi:hypothetical protein